MKHLGLLAHYCGIRPWEVGRLTVPEFWALIEFVEKANTPPEKE